MTASRGSFWKRSAASQYRYLYDATLRLVPVGARVLDWGCGDGHFSHFLVALGYRVDSFSLQNRPSLFERWPPDERARPTFTRGDPSEPVRLPYPDRTFDAVVSAGVLAGVSSPTRPATSIAGTTSTGSPDVRPSGCSPTPDSG